jgi:hypothetical protein
VAIKGGISVYKAAVGINTPNNIMYGIYKRIAIGIFG